MFNLFGIDQRTGAEHTQKHLLLTRLNSHYISQPLDACTKKKNACEHIIAQKFISSQMSTPVGARKNKGHGPNAHEHKSTQQKPNRHSTALDAKAATATTAYKVQQHSRAYAMSATQIPAKQSDAPQGRSAHAATTKSHDRAAATLRPRGA